MAGHDFKNPHLKKKNKNPHLHLSWLRETILKDYRPYDSIYLKFSKRQNYGDKNHISNCWEVGARQHGGFF